MRCVISAIYPVLVQPFQSTEQTRYYLNGFYVHPNPGGGLRIVATDGHKLGVFHDADGTWDGKPGEKRGVIVKLNRFALAMLKEKSVLPRWLIIEGDLEKNEVTGTVVESTDLKEGPVHHVGTFEKILVDGDFPDYQRVIPPMEGKVYYPQSYQTRFLQDFAKIKPGRIRIVSRDQTGPALVLTDRIDFFGVLMPHSPGWEAYNDFPEFWHESLKAQAKPKRGRKKKGKGNLEVVPPDGEQPEAEEQEGTEGQPEVEELEESATEEVDPEEEAA